MAYLDSSKEAAKKKAKEGYELHKEELKTGGRFDLWIYLEEQELKLKELENEIKRYQQFFSTLNSFLPEKFDMNTRIY